MNRWRNCSTAVSSVVRRAKVPQNYRARPSFTSVSFLADEEKRYSTPANANNPGLVKNPSRRVEYFDELNQTLPATRVSEILKMNAMLRYFLSLTLKLASNHLHITSSNWFEGSHSTEGNADRVLVENNFDTTSATGRSKFSVVLLQLLCGNGQMHN